MSDGVVDLWGLSLCEVLTCLNTMLFCTSEANKKKKEQMRTISTPALKPPSCLFHLVVGSFLPLPFITWRKCLYFLSSLPWNIHGSATRWTCPPNHPAMQWSYLNPHPLQLPWTFDNDEHTLLFLLLTPQTMTSQTSRIPSNFLSILPLPWLLFLFLFH